VTEVWTTDPLLWRSHCPSAVAIGVFDGVHRGHQAVIEDLVEGAAALGLCPIALTFDPHPLEFLAPERAPRLLGSIEHRVELLGRLGVEIVGVLPFPIIRDLAPAVFATEVLSDRLMARQVAVGADFRFGRDREGDLTLLTEAGARAGFEVKAVSLVTAAGGEVVSSSQIRSMLEQGEVEAAERMLGRPFELRGPVIHGDARGRAIGFPTANLHIPDRLAVPAYGVYAAWAHWEGLERPAVVNIGVRPTFGKDGRTVEAHLLGFDGDLYGVEMTLRFVERIRPEVRFDGVEALVAQIGRDVQAAAAILGRPA